MYNYRRHIMHIYSLNISSPIWTENETYLLNYVSLERREKLMRYMNDSDKKLSLYAALIARFGLSLLTNVPNSKLIFRCSPNQKPLLLSVPEYDFSFSHTNYYILCCISSEGKVGADVEKIQEIPFKNMKSIFHPDEIEYIQCSSNSQKNIRFFEVWTKKEAFTKQLGTGLTNNLSSINTLSPSIASHLYTWVDKSYHCCVCGKENSSLNLNSISEKDIWNYFVYGG